MSKPEADSIEQPDSSDIEQILRKYGSDLAFFIAKNPKLDDFGLQCETDVLIGEAKSQLEAMMVKERINELERINALGDGLGRLAKHALTIGVHVEDRIASLKSKLEKSHDRRPHS